MKIIVKICFVMIALALLFPMLSGQVSVCCEKTNYGAWCINDVSENCNQAYKIAPTACESTSYCKAGCCFDSLEGLCWENTPQRICDQKNGTWSEDPGCNIRQCNLGCCILGDQAALVTLTRCKSMSGFYGLVTDFRADITDELICIATANAQDKGACVFEEPETGTKTCIFGTRADCGAAEAEAGENVTITETGRVFYKDILCSAEELGTECGPSTKTTLIEGKDEVYFLDSCGNIANIYDANKYDDDAYWRNVYSKEDSCGYGNDNANSRTCGNCDYFLGSIGREAGRLNRPTYGDYICVDLDCEGHTHGESWCVTDPDAGSGKDRVGSRYYKKVCLNNEILVEPCADFRNEVCFEQTTGGFTEAACRVNRWQDCLDQEEEEDCTNTAARDCMWIEGYYYVSGSGILPKNVSTTGTTIATVEGVCVPMYSPGFQFWGESSTTTTTTGATTFNATSPTFGTGTGAVSTSVAASSSSALCALGNSEVTVSFEGRIDEWYDVPEELFREEKDLTWTCKQPKKLCDLIGDKNPEDVTAANLNSWANEMNVICRSLGDCGGYVNWIGKSTDDGYAAYLNNTRFAGSGGAKVLSSTTTTTTSAVAETGNVISDIIKKMTGEDDEK